MKGAVLIIFLILINGCVNSEDRSVITKICNADNVESVYDCMDFVEIANTDGSSRYYTEDGSFSCPFEPPSATSLECQRMFEAKRATEIICKNLCK